MEMDRMVSLVRASFTFTECARVGDVDLPMTHPKKAFMAGALEKEVRLSFAQRIRGTLPEPYQPLLPEAKEQDVPVFKYADDRKLSHHAPVTLTELMSSR